MSDTFVTLHGWVGSEITFRDPNGTSVANFRVASTPRIKKGGEWKDGDTTWYSVTAWRHLAVNVRDSVRKGDAVVVHGRLRTENWERGDGQVSTTLRIEATLVGHDLTRGTSAFLRTPRPGAGEAEVERTVEEMIRDQEQQGSPGYDSWGNQTDPPTQEEEMESAGAA